MPWPGVCVFHRTFLVEGPHPKRPRGNRQAAHICSQPGACVSEGGRSGWICEKQTDRPAWGLWWPASLGRRAAAVSRGWVEVSSAKWSPHPNGALQGSANTDETCVYRSKAVRATQRHLECVSCSLQPERPVMQRDKPNGHVSWVVTEAEACWLG